MEIRTCVSELADTGAAANAILSELRDADPALVLVSYTEHHEPADLRDALIAGLPGTEVLGSSTCRGVLTDKGLAGFGKPALAVFAILDMDGDYGAATEPCTGDTGDCVAAAIRRAQAAADRQGEVPELVWLHTSPGLEEGAIAAIHSILGEGVIVAGGSSADETIGGKWTQFDTTNQTGTGVSVALLFPETPITHHFRNGYLPTEQSGRVTRASGRCLAEIDGEPAAEVYNRWTGGLIDNALADRTLSILGTSSWHPIGRSIGDLAGGAVAVQSYCLLHPDSVGPDGELNLFANADEGTELTLMHSGPEELVRRAADVAVSSLDRVGKDATPKGAVMVFCAGCMLALGPEIDSAAAMISEAYGDMPFLCMFTFGEQGSFANGHSQHGNLMISSTLINAPD